MSENRDIAQPPLQRSRRDWLKSVVRYGALVGLVGGIGNLVLRTDRPLPSGQSGACRQTPCRTCRLAARCDLPKANVWRAQKQAGGES